MSKKTRDAPNISNLRGHSRDRNTLKPPFSRLANVSLHSWSNERLPKVLWAVILTGAFDRQTYLDLFRRVLDGARGIPEDQVFGLDHGHIAMLSPENFAILFKPVLSDDQARKTLGSLLLFDELPDRAHWERHVDQPSDEDAFAWVAGGVAVTLDHQSQEATDCRWVRLCAKLAIGKMHFAEHLSEMAHEIVEYPNRGDPRSVRPKIRAGESGLDMGPDDEDEWPATFWREGWRKTHCIPAPRKIPKRLPDKSTLESLFWIYTNVANHFVQISEDTALDPRKDAVFGLVLFCLTIGMRSIQTGDHERPEGRIIVRSLAECCLTLSYLLKIDDPSLWSKYRDYGTGQAKLAFLKLYELDDADVPSFVNIDELERLANEDVWQEFASIDLGNWAKSDLRSMAEHSGLKEIYDKYYAWPSGYVHGQWGAVRDTVFDLCLNPLHGYHRIPSLPRIDMPSSIP